MRLIIGATITALATACGTSTSTSTAPATGDVGAVGTAQNESGLREAARAYLDAWSTGNTATICTLLEARTAAEFTAKVRAPDCPAAVHVLYDRMSDQVRASLRDVQFTEVKQQSGSGTQGHVVVGAKVPVLGNDLSTDWSYKSGRWQIRERPRE
ncbi:hypothetical protein H480_26962 [Amycolatopsis vancoresmycina DSM 44592]|uniref:Lipoprotein n=2 Tax=Amycolatopsis vancoresmycina TaxID=208444 RepID=R1G1H2_9PSEU|nr:hypothetical protein H480_26962 [Amycolatopsis vancoresmycina DSM 44592]